MKSKLIYILVLLALTFASAGATNQPKTSIRVFFQEQANGDYRLYLFGSNRALVCEEKPIQIIQQGDAINPVVLECGTSYPQFPQY